MQESMQEFHHNRARDLIKNAELLFDQDAVQASITRMADVLNTRFNAEDSKEFPLVLGVMGGAVVFTGSLLPQLSFPLEFDYIHVSRYGDDDKGGEVVWKVIPARMLRAAPSSCSTIFSTKAKPSRTSSSACWTWAPRK